MTCKWRLDPNQPDKCGEAVCKEVVRVNDVHSGRVKEVEVDSDYCEKHLARWQRGSHISR